MSVRTTTACLTTYSGMPPSIILASLRPSTEQFPSVMALLLQCVTKPLPNQRWKLVGACRLGNEFFFSAPQLKRGPLGSGKSCSNELRSLSQGCSSLSRAPCSRARPFSPAMCAPIEGSSPIPASPSTVAWEPPMVLPAIAFGLSARAASSAFLNSACFPHRSTVSSGSRTSLSTRTLSFELWTGNGQAGCEWFVSPQRVRSSRDRHISYARGRTSRCLTSA